MGTGDSADPDQTPHHVASDQGPHCMLTGFSIKTRLRPEFTSKLEHG